MGQDNLKTIHKPLMIFYYGSIAVIFLSLFLGAYYFSYHFLKNENKRAEINNLQVKESLSTELRYIEEEFFTQSYDSIMMRIQKSLIKFGNPDFELYLFNTDGVCFYANGSSGNNDCKYSSDKNDNFLTYETDLKFTTNILGKMKVKVQDRFQFYTGSLAEFAFNMFAPIFLLVAILWIGWVVFSRNKILVPYIQKMLAMEKDKASFDTIRQIIHDTKGEIASLYNLCPEIEELDKSKAMEIQATLDKIQKAFNNLHQVKDSIQPLKEELRHEVFNLMSDIEAHERFKYRHMENLVLEFNLSQINKEKLKLDSSLFERVISNLIENAVTAPCDKEVRTVNVNAFRSDDSIIFQVFDNGNGISKENISQVFEKGFTTKANGTGQGLAFVKAQIESWGGQISIESELNVGTKVTFSVPLPIKQQVIILDDNLRLLTRYEKMVERTGSDAKIYNTAKDMIADAKSFHPDSIILLDYDLGTEEVGIDVAKKLSQMGLKNLYLHTGNPMTDEMNYTILKGVLSKGNFVETLAKLSV
jgi:hypothetical protein